MPATAQRCAEDTLLYEPSDPPQPYVARLRFRVAVLSHGSESCELAQGGACQCAPDQAKLRAAKRPQCTH